MIATYNKVLCYLLIRFFFCQNPNTNKSNKSFTLLLLLNKPFLHNKYNIIVVSICENTISSYLTINRYVFSIDHRAF